MLSQVASAFAMRNVEYLTMEKMDGKTKFLARCAIFECMNPFFF
jgi:hypothetical protein